MTREPDKSRSELIERLRDRLGDEASRREMSMFGGRSFMINDKMVVNALGGGDLLARVPADQHEALVARPGAAQAEMGTGRSMGPGWIAVTAAAIAADEELSFWLEVARDYNRAITGA